MKLDQAYIEQHIGWMIVLIVLVVSVGGLWGARSRSWVTNQR